MQGPTKAPITLVQYGDYECPSCGQAFPIVKALQKRLGTKMRFVFRNFPLQQHAHALHAAEIAEAASVHNKFWDMHDMLYRHQAALDDQSLLGYAIEVGLDPDLVGKEASSDKVVSRIKADLKSGNDSGIQGTPAFFINGQSHDEAWDEESLFAAMERVLEDQ